MKALLILTDTTGQCHKALEYLKDFSEKLHMEGEVFIILEDLYKLEKASVSLGFPLPPETVPQTKDKVLKKVKHIWESVGGEDLTISVVAGEIRDEVTRYVKETGDVGLVMWGCNPSVNVCSVIDDIDIPSLIIK